METAVWISAVWDSAIAPHNLPEASKICKRLNCFRIDLLTSFWLGLFADSKVSTTWLRSSLESSFMWVSKVPLYAFAFSNLTFEMSIFYFLNDILCKNTAPEGQLKSPSLSWQQAGESYNYDSHLTGKQKLDRGWTSTFSHWHKSWVNSNQKGVTSASLLESKTCLKAKKGCITTGRRILWSWSWRPEWIVQTRYSTLGF